MIWYSFDACFVCATHRFNFMLGSKECNTSTRGFWTIDVESEGVKYTRNTHGDIFTKFEVPLGASYACGNNSHNIFRPPIANTSDKFIEGGVLFSGLQV